MLNRSDIASEKLVNAAIEAAQTDCEARTKSEQENHKNAINEILKAFIERELDIRRNGSVTAAKHQERIDALFDKAQQHEQKVDDLERQLETLRQIAKRPGDIVTAIKHFSPRDQA